tara:strand:- start:528 stop:683 length:156 start_codon:yes stop_codon:yes gene_type:complete
MMTEDNRDLLIEVEHQAQKTKFQKKTMEDQADEIEDQRKIIAELQKKSEKN